MDSEVLDFQFAKHPIGARMMAYDYIGNIRLNGIRQFDDAVKKLQLEAEENLPVGCRYEIRFNDIADFGRTRDIAFYSQPETFAAIDDWETFNRTYDETKADGWNWDCGYYLVARDVTSGDDDG